MSYELPPPPTAHGQTDPNAELNHQMADLTVGHTQEAGFRKKRPARVFHPVASPYSSHSAPTDLVPELNSNAPYITSANDFISPIDRAVSAHSFPQATPGFSEPGGASFQPQYPGITGNPPSSAQYPQFNRVDPQLQQNQQAGIAQGSSDAIPSIISSRADAQAKLGPNPLFKTLENAYPPQSVTDFDVQDQGLSGPQFARLTMYNIPDTEALRASTKLPLGMVLRPFAPFSNKEYQAGGVSSVDFSHGIPPPRCSRCRTYMNPAMLFSSGGMKYTCNMCQFVNDVSPEYYQPIDFTQRRIDWHTRPELAFGTYDIIAPKEYWKEKDIEPSPLHHLILIDVSRESIKKGLPKLAAEAIRAVLYGPGIEPGENAVDSYGTEEEHLLDEHGNPIVIDKGIKYPPHAKIGIATYDKTVQFFNLSPKLEQAQMIVMSDLMESFVPLEEGLFVNPKESRYVIEDLLNKLDVLYEDSSNDQPCYGTALEVALKALRETGGKVTACFTSLTSIGAGPLVVRENTENFRGEKEKDLYEPDNKFYENLAKEYATSGVGLDLFLFPSTLVDLTNSGIVCQKSGGHQYLYPRFVPQRDGRTFIADFCRSCEGEIGTQAQLKVRCSTGLQVAAYYGNFYNEGWDEDPIIGTVDSHTNIGILFKHDGKLDSKLDVHFQSALLYTSSSGERRVRVTNLLASVTDKFKPSVNFVDLDATMGVIARDTVSRLGKTDIKSIRERLNSRLIDVFANYRLNAGTSFPPNQLLMPLSLWGFIAQMLSLQKTIPLRDEKISSDARIHFVRLINSMSTEELSLFLYPRIIGLHNLRSTDCSYTESGLFNMPVNVKASMEALEAGGVYFAFNGQQLILWIQKQVSPLLLRDLFGEYISNVGQLESDLNELPEVDTEVSRQARNLVKYFSNKVGIRFLGIKLAREELDGACYEFLAMLVEDKFVNSLGYVEYMSQIHRSVKTELENLKEKQSKTKFISEHFFSQAGL